MFVHSSLSSQSSINPCSSMKCSSICLLTLTSARCACPQGSVPHDALSESCIFLDSNKDVEHLPPTKNSDRVSKFSDEMERTTKTDEEVDIDDVSIEATVDDNGMKDGAILALTIIIILAVFVAGIFLCVKCRNSVKKQEVALM